MVEIKSTKVRVELYASKLKNVAGAFKGTSDPYAVVTLLANDLNEQPRVLGKTEVCVFHFCYLLESFCLSRHCLLIFLFFFILESKII